MYRYYVISNPTGFQFLSTPNWQTAIDTWSEVSASCPTHAIDIEVHKDVEDYSVRVKTLNNKEEIQKHSEYLLYLEQSKENRVNKRLVQQEYDGMEIVHPKDEHGFYTTHYEPQESYDDFIRRAVKAADDIAEEEYELLSELSDDVQEHLKEIDFHGDFENMSWEQQDDIINPKHYKIIPAGTYENGLEYMDICEHALSHLDGVEAHLVGQILKYTLRVGKKDAKLQDARKIEWYASRLVDTVTGD